MNRIKRCITVILFLVIAMTGIYWCENPVKEVQAETTTEANSDMLSLKFQRGITDATINKIRVVASVDSPNYSAVGFAIAIGDGEEQLFTINTKEYPLPQRIKSSVEGMEYLFSPKVIDTSGEYFLTAKWTAVASTKYTVRAWAKTFDGDMIYGQSRCITLEDLSTTQYLNMSFELKDGCTLSMAAEDETKYADINVTYNGTTTTAEVIDVKEHENGKTVYVNVKDVNRTALPSATKFVFKDSENAECGSTIFRNLYTSYSETTEGETTTNTADTSWYTVYNQEDSAEDEFVIATNADMYGFAQLVNNGNTFADTKVYMVSNIALNIGLAKETGWSTSEADGTTAIEGATSHVWTPIAYTTGRFKGIFDGQNHEISGVNGVPSTDATESYVGLFGYVNGGTIKSIQLTNSYFGSTGTALGSIAGRCDGAIDTVYSDAILNCTQGCVGGIAGWMKSEENASYEYKQCWFAGKILTVDAQCGGIVGQVRRGNLSVEDCLFTGNIEFSFEASGNETGIGGLVGYQYDNEGKANLTVKNSLNTGTIEKATTVEASTFTKVARIVGNYRNKGASVGTLDISNSYHTNSGINGGIPYYQRGTANTSENVTIVTESDITGLASYYNQILVHTTDTAWVPTTGTVALKAFAQSPMSVNEPDDINLDWYTGIADNYTICGETDTNDVKVAKLRGFAYLVNAGVSFEGKTVYLGADVDMNEGWTASATPEVAPNKWIPIGANDYGFEFAGTFDGGFDGGLYSISGIYIVTEQQGAGLFRTTAQGSKIQNLRLLNSYIISEYDSTYGCVGSIVGSCAGSLENIYSNAYVVSDSGATGGLIGEMWSDENVSVKQCWFAGEIDAVHNAGGLIGMYTSANELTLTMENCLNSGDIKYNSADARGCVGGLIGRRVKCVSRWATGTASTSASLVMKYCLNYGQLLPSSSETLTNIGSIYGCIQNGKTTTFTSVYMTSESYTVRGCTAHTHCKKGTITSVSKDDITGLNADTNEFELLANGWVSTLTTPVPAVFASYAETIDVAWYDGDRIIDTRAELVGLSYLSQTQSIDKDIALGANIDLNPGWTASETSGRPDIVWSPVGNEQYPFTGTLNGNGYTISGIYVDDAIEYMGFFGVADDSSEIKNLRIENSYFNQQATEGNGYVGSVAGELRGSMTNVYSNAIVKSNYEQIAGMVARVNANTSAVNIIDCWFNGTIMGGTAGRYLGGIVSMIVSGTCNFENVLFTGVIDSDYNGVEQVTIGGILADGMSETEKLVFESVISAGKIIGNHNHRAVHAIFGNVRTSILNSGTTNAAAQTPEVDLSNVFASRTCYPTAYSCASVEGIRIDENGEEVTFTSKATVTGQVMFTTGDDRLLGYIPQRMYLEEEKTEVTSALGFYENGDWSLRKDGVPIPTVLTDVVDTEITDVDYLSETDEEYQNLEGYLTKQIRLDWFGGSIDDLVPYGAGNYLVSYKDITEKKYTDYLSKISADNRKFKTDYDTSTSEMTDDGVYSTVYYRKDIEWVLNITYLKNLSTVYISINTDLSSISSNLQPVTQSGTAPISFSMLEMHNSEKLGNSFVFQLPDGHFVVNDGGKKDDATYLLNYMKALAGTSNGEQNPVYIDAWIVTHYHSDHCGAMANLTAENNVFIEAVYACEPSMYGLTVKENVYGNVNAALKGITKFTKRDGTRPDFYQLHMGQRFYFNGITMDVIDTQEQNLDEKWADRNTPDRFNSTSTSCIYTFVDANGTTQRVIIGGDGNNANMTYIMSAFGDSDGKSNTLSDINVYVAYHHGLNTTCTRVSGDFATDSEGYKYLRVGTKDWADFLLKNIAKQKFDMVLFPSAIVESASQGVYDGENWYVTSTGLKDFSYNIGDMNQYFIDNAVDKRHYTYGNGTVRMTFGEEHQVEVCQPGEY